MSDRLCVYHRCTVYSEHVTERCRDGCRGCKPRPATVGFLCKPCCEQMGERAMVAARLHAELELDLVNKSGGGASGGGVNPFPGVAYNSAAAEARSEIQNNLAGWCRILVEEAGYQPPEPRWRIDALPLGVHGPAGRVKVAPSGIAHLGQYLWAHRAWLAAHEAADEICEHMAELVHIGRFNQEKVRSSKVDMGQCPSCEGRLTASIRREDAGAGSAVVCDGPERHRWESYQWASLRKQQARRAGA